MPYNENLSWLYNTLTERGMNLGTIEETAEAISADENNRRWLYEAGRNNGINMGSYEEFEEAMGLPKFQAPIKYGEEPIEMKSAQPKAEEPKQEDDYLTSDMPEEVEPEEEYDFNREVLKDYVPQFKNEIKEKFPNARLYGFSKPVQLGGPGMSYVGEEAYIPMEDRQRMNTLSEQLKLGQITKEQYENEEKAIRQKAVDKMNEQFSEDTLNASAALHLMNQAQKRVKLVDGRTKSNIVNTFRGVGHFDYAGLNPALQFIDAYRSFALLNKVAENPDAELSESEQYLLQAIVTNNAVNDTFQTNMAERIGQGLPESMAFMAQFALTGGVGSAVGKLAKEGVEKVIKKGLKNATRRLYDDGFKGLLQKGIDRTVNTVIPGVVGATTAAATQTILNPAGLASGTYERAAGTAEYTLAPDGTPIATGEVTGRMGLGEAFAKEFGAQTIEQLSERAGASLGIATGAGKAVVKTTGKAIASKVPGVQKAADAFVEFADNMKKTKVGDLVGKAAEWLENKDLGVKALAQKVGWNGTIEEWYEEQANTLLNAMFVGDEELSALFNGERQLETFLSVAVVGGATRLLSAPAAIEQRAEVRKEKQNLKNTISDIEKRVQGNSAMSNALKAVATAVDTGTVGDVAIAINEANRQLNLDTDTKRMFLDYASARMMSNMWHSNDRRQASKLAEGVYAEVEARTHKQSGTITVAEYTDKDGNKQNVDIIDGVIIRDGGKKIDSTLSDRSVVVRMQDGTTQMVPSKSLGNIVEEIDPALYRAVLAEANTFGTKATYDSEYSARTNEHGVYYNEDGSLDYYHATPAQTALSLIDELGSAEAAAEYAAIQIVGLQGEGMSIEAQNALSKWQAVSGLLADITAYNAQQAAAAEGKAPEGVVPMENPLPVDAAAPARNLRTGDRLRLTVDNGEMAEATIGSKTSDGNYLVDFDDTVTIGGKKGVSHELTPEVIAAMQYVEEVQEGDAELQAEQTPEQDDVTSYRDMVIGRIPMKADGSRNWEAATPSDAAQAINAERDGDFDASIAFAQQMAQNCANAVAELTNAELEVEDPTNADMVAAAEAQRAQAIASKQKTADFWSEVTNILNTANTERTKPTEQEPPVEEETPTPEDAMPMIDEDTPDFVSAGPERSAEFLSEQFGDDAESFIQDNIAEAQKALADAQGKKPKSTNFAERKKENEAIAQEKVVATAALDFWNAVGAAYAARQSAVAEEVAQPEVVESAEQPATAVEEQPAEEQPAEEQPAEEVAQPEVVEETTVAEETEEAPAEAPEVAEEATATQPEEVAQPEGPREIRTQQDVESIPESEFKAGVEMNSAAQAIANVEAMDKIAKALGVRVVFVEDVDGGIANGKFDRKTKTIYIAGNRTSGEQFVVGHEMLHRMAQVSPDAYERYKQFVLNELGEEEVNRRIENLKGLYQRVIDTAKKQGKRPISMPSEEILVEEVIADFTGKVINSDNTSFAKLAERLARNDKPLLRALRDAIEHIRSFFKKSSVEARKYTRRLKAIEKLLSDSADATLEHTSISTTSVADSKSGKAFYSLATYDQSGRADLQEFLNSRVISGDLTEVEAADILSQMDAIYEVCQQFKDKYVPFGKWSEAAVVEDEEGNPIFSVIKQNGEYAMNLDFSLVCKKRRTLDAVLNEMIARGMIETATDDPVFIAQVNDVIRKYGFETACRLCFVDAKRFRVVKVAQQFADLYNEVVKRMVPKGSNITINSFDYAQRGVEHSENALDTQPDSEVNIEALKKMSEGKSVKAKIAKHLLENPQDRKFVVVSDFVSTKGFDAVATENPALLGLYNSKKGSGGPKAAFSDVQYLGDVAKANWDAEKAYAVGGVRVQSFSDFVPRMVFDYIQMVGDLAAKKLPVHAYTKEPIFAKMFGLTGIKINLSLVPAVAENGVAAGLDSEGNYVWQEGETFPYEEALALQNAEGYKENVGTIAVGVSDEHILKMLDDDNIRMVIPYHKSGLNPAVAKANNIDGFKDYTSEQNTRYSNGKKLSKEDATQVPDFNQQLRELGSAKAAADAYLAWCAENDYKPKFDKFASHPNYYKLLEDFTTTVDGKNAPQEAVKFNFPTEADAFGSLASLIEQGLEEDAILEGMRDEKVSQIVDELEDARYSLKAMDAPYLEAVERGDMETAQRMVMEAAKLAMPNTKVVDENGNPKVVYHQTNVTIYRNIETGEIWDDLDWRAKMEWDERDDWDDYWQEEDFNTFSRVNARTTQEFDGFFFAPEYDEYHEYGDRTIAAFLNIENPASNRDYNIDSSKNNAGREERIRLQNEGFDGVIREYDGVVDEYIAFEPNQIKSADAVTYDDNGNVIPLSERFNPNKDDVRYSLMGERGAANLDAAEEVTTRLDNLNVAREMEKADKDAKTIKMATGWERGADGKWRYEIEDLKLANPEEWVNKKGRLTLKDIVTNAEELFAAYPELRDVKIKKSAANNNNGAYNPEEKTITLSVGILRRGLEIQNNIERFHTTKEEIDRAMDLVVNLEVRGTLLHEIQHAIQHIEGFARGGNEKMTDVSLDAAKVAAIEEEMVRQINEKVQQYNSMPVEERRTPAGARLRVQIEEGKRRYSKYVKSSQLGYEGYKKLAGEVEARNVAKRLGMTPEERRNTLAAETEDVARKDQIILQRGLEVAEKRQIRSVRLPKTEYAKLSSIIMTRQHTYKRPSFDYAFTDGNFYVYNYLGDGISIVNFAIPIVGNEEIIDVIYNAIDNGTVNSPRSLDSFIEEIRSGKRGDITYNTNVVKKYKRYRGLYIYGPSRESNNPSGVDGISDDDSRGFTPRGENGSANESTNQDVDYRFSIRETDPEILEQLNNGETIKAYRAMQVIAGKLYPPMSAKVEGKLREPIELGVWERAEERPDLADSKGYFKLDKGNKSSVPARYNPYIHTSLTPLNDQFSSAQDRPNLVTVEVEIPESELTSGYKADKAKDSVGKLEWKAGVVQSQLSGTRTVILSRWDRPLRIVPDNEVAERIVEMFDGKEVVMPSNVVTPSLRAELEKLGVPFRETDNQGRPRNTVRHRTKAEYTDSQRVIAAQAQTLSTAEIEEYINEVAKSLPEGVKVVVTNSVESGDREHSGWYDMGTDTVYINADMCDNTADVDATIVHELVGHRSMPTAIARVIGRTNATDRIALYTKLATMLPKELLDRVMAKTAADMDLGVAVDEVLAEAVENADLIKPSVWQRICSEVRAFFRRVFNRGISLSDGDIKYMFWFAGSKLGEDAKYIESGGIRHRLGILENKRNSALPTEEQREYEEDVIAKTARFAEAWVDSLNPLKKLQETVAKHHGALESWENAYDIELGRPSRTMARSNMMLDRFLKPLITAISAFTNNGISRETLMHYMVAKHGLERNDYFRNKRLRELNAQINEFAKEVAQGYIYKDMSDTEKAAIVKSQFIDYEPYLNMAEVEKALEWYASNDADYTGSAITDIEAIPLEDMSGLTGLAGVLNGDPDAKPEEIFTEVAEKLVEKFEKENGEAVNTLWDKVRDLNNATLLYQLEGGIISQELYQNIRSMYHYYIPLRGWAEETSDAYYEYTSKEARIQTVVKGISKRGRKSLAEDPIANMANMLQSAVVITEKNASKQAFVRMALNRPDSSLVRVVKTRYVKTQKPGGRVEWKAEYPNIPEKASQAEADAIIAQFDADTKAMVAAGTARVKTSKIDVGVRVKPQHFDEHLVSAMFNGEEVLVFVNGSPKAVQALNGTNASKFDKFMDRLFGGFTRWMAKINTTWSSKFIQTNLTRDWQWSRFVARVEHGPKYYSNFKKNYYKALVVLPKLLINGTSKLSDAQLDDFTQIDDPTLRYFTEFVYNGGETGFSTTLTTEQWKKEIDKQVKAIVKGKSPIRVLKGILGTLEGMNRWAEDIPRFAAYLTSREMGKNVSDSINDAKEISVNFSRHGSGGWLNGSFRRLYAFFNASIQGTYKLVNLAKEHPARFFIAAAPYLLTGGLLPLLNTLLLAAFGDDDDMRNYEYMSNYNNTNRIIIFNPFGEKHGFVSIPISHEVVPFYGIGNVVGRRLLGFDKHIPIEEQVAELVVSALPLDFVNSEGLNIRGFIPTGVQTPYDIAENADFMGNPIYYEYDAFGATNKNHAAFTKAPIDTWKWLVGLSRAISRATGGDGIIKPGWIDPNPATIQYAIEGYLGGLASTAKRLTNFTKGIIADAKGEDEAEQYLSAYNTPLLSALYRDSNEFSAYKQVDEVYDKYQAISEFYVDIVNKYAEEYGDDIFEFSAKVKESLNSEEYKIYMVFNGSDSDQELIKGIKRKEKELKEAYKVGKPKAEIDAIKSTILIGKLAVIDAVNEIHENAESDEIKSKIFTLGEELEERINNN